MSDLSALITRILGRKSKIDYKTIATEQKQYIDQYEDIIRNLLKSSSTPIPVVDEYYRHQTEYIQLPRYAFRIDPNWYYWMRMDSVTLRTVALKIRQEIFRETLKEGLLWEGKYNYRCNNCGVEYTEEVEYCIDCQGQSFRKPDIRQKDDMNDLIYKANRSEQTLMDVCQEFEDDLQDYDDGYLVLIKDYAQLGTTLLGKIKEIYRGDPKLFRIVADKKGRRGGVWVCPHHRQLGQTRPGVCQQEGCNFLLQEAFYAESEGGGPDAAVDTHNKESKYKFYIEGEVIHASKYAPTALYGTSPVYTIWVICRTLICMDIYVQKLYEKGRKKGILVFNTDNFDSIRALLSQTEERLKNDPHYIPAFGVQHESGRGKAEFVKMVDSLAEMNYIPAKELMNRQIAAIYGVMPVFQADLSTSGGLNNEGLQIKVTDRAVDFGQSIYHNIVFPRLLKALGITDWKLKLRPSRETDEMAELQRWHQQLESARLGAELGLDIELKEGQFEYSGKVTSPTQQFPALPPAPTFPAGATPASEVPQEETDLGAPCPPGKHRTVENPRCHPIEWDLGSKETNLTKSLELEKDNPNTDLASMKVFDMYRKHDIHGKSGTGYVGTGIVFPDLTTVFRWNSQTPSTNIYANFSDFEATHVKGHEANKTKIDFYDLKKTDLDNLLKQQQESGKKLTAGRNKIENKFSENIANLYTKLYFTRLEAAPKTLSKKEILAEIDTATEQIREPLEKEGWLEVNRAYFKGKKSVNDLKKATSPDWLNWEKLPFSKSDRAVLQAIYSRNPFWDSFTNLSQAVSDKFKEIITESYMAPTEAAFVAELKNVQEEYPEADRERQLRITYGRVGKFSLPRIIKEMKDIVLEEVYRLERIARTETTAITATGREQAFRETDPENQNRYEWFGPLDHRTSDECREIGRQVKEQGQGRGVTLDELKTIMKSVVTEANRPRRSKWQLRDWSPHANCRRVLRRVV